MFENDSINILGSINADRALLIQADLNGNILNQKQIQTNTTQFYFSEKSSELILVGNSKSGSLSLEKINGIGNLIWQHTYSFPGFDNANFTEIKISNNSYTILGVKNNSGIGEPEKSISFLLKTLFDGTEVWQKTINDEVDVIRCIDLLEDENIISAISNSTYEDPGEIRFYLEMIYDY